MPAPQNGLPPLPAGYENYAPVQSAAPTTGGIPPLPAGYENYKTIPNLASPSSEPVVVQGAKDLAIGAGKSLVNTPIDIAAMGAQGVNAVAGKPVVKVPQPYESTGTMQSAGMFGGDLAQFALGEEGLKSLGLLAHLGANSPEILKLIQDYPKAADFISKIATSGTVGAVQGALQGAPEGQTVAGAEGGALGGAVGAAGTEAAGAAVTKVARMTGLGGMKPEEAMAKAIRPSVQEQKFMDNAKLAMPRLVAEDARSPIKTVDDLADAAHTAKTSIWQNEIAPVIAQHANETIDGASIAREIKAEVSPSTRKLFPETAKKIDEWADNFIGPLGPKTAKGVPQTRIPAPMTLQEANDHVVELNQRLRSFYKTDPSTQFSMATANPELGMLEDATDAIRGRIDQKLQSLGAPDIASLRKEYGALNQMQRVAEKRSVVYGRQSPINLPQAIGLIQAAATGHPAAAAMGFLAKGANDSNRLVNTAIRTARPDTTVEKVVKGGVKGTGMAARGAAAKAGASENKTPDAHPDLSSWIHVRHQGQEYLVHPDDVPEAQNRIPGLEMVSPDSSSSSETPAATE